MIDLALMAKSGDDFDAMFRSVFDTNSAVWLTGLTIRGPPGGGRYVEHDGAVGIAIHNEALAKVGMMNVMWHGAAGDTVPVKRSDFALLTKNMNDYASDGSVLVIHDYIRADALASSLDRIERDPQVSVITMAQAVAAGSSSTRIPGRRFRGSFRVETRERVTRPEEPVPAAGCRGGAKRCPNRCR